LVNDLQQRCDVSVSGARLLILGAGGACQGIIHPLLEAGVQRVYIANRTLARAQNLVANLTGEQSTRVQALDITGIENDHPSVGLVINSTALGLKTSGLQALNELPSGLVEGRCCYDLSYGKQAQFAQWAKINGASRSFDGLGMLVEQAAESYAIWTGSRPHTEAVYERLRESVA
jgi:shikimate dehydrogenase